MQPTDDTTHYEDFGQNLIKSISIIDRKSGLLKIFVSASTDNPKIAVDLGWIHVPPKNYHQVYHTPRVEIRPALGGQVYPANLILDLMMYNKFSDMPSMALVNDPVRHRGLNTIAAVYKHLTEEVQPPTPAVTKLLSRLEEAILKVVLHYETIAGLFYFFRGFAAMLRGRFSTTLSDHAQFDPDSMTEVLPLINHTRAIGLFDHPVYLIPGGQDARPHFLKAAFYSHILFFRARPETLCLPGLTDELIGVLESVIGTRGFRVELDFGPTIKIKTLDIICGRFSQHINNGLNTFDSEPDANVFI